MSGPEGSAALKRARRMLDEFLTRQGAAGIRIRCRLGEPAQAGQTGKIKRIVAAA